MGLDNGIVVRATLNNGKIYPFSARILTPL